MTDNVVEKKKIIIQQSDKIIKELEQIKNSIIILDEFNTLIDTENRKHKKQVEQKLSSQSIHPCTDR